MSWYQKIVGEQNVLWDRSYTRWNQLDESAVVEKKQQETARTVEKDKPEEAKKKTDRK
jgi:hypothetical protein